MGPNVSISWHPLRSAWLACDLQQTQILSRLSPLIYSMLGTSFGATVRQMHNENGNYMEVYHLLHIRNVYIGVKIKSSESVFVTYFFELLCISTFAPYPVLQHTENKKGLYYSALYDGHVTYLSRSVPTIWTVYQNRRFVIFYFIYNPNSSS